MELHPTQSAWKLISQQDLITPESELLNVQMRKVLWEHNALSVKSALRQWRHVTNTRATAVSVGHVQAPTCLFPHVETVEWHCNKEKPKIMLRWKIPSYRIHGRLNCDPTVRNGQRQDVIQNSFWHYEIRCTWGWGDQKRHQIEKYVAPQQASHAGFPAVRNGDTPMCRPLRWAGPDAGCEGSEPERSLLHWLTFKAWLPYSRSRNLNSRSSERLHQQILRVGPLVFRRYAFVFGCFLQSAYHLFC